MEENNKKYEHEIEDTDETMEDNEAEDKDAGKASEGETLE